MSHALNGACHCGAVRVSFESPDMDAVAVFACTCSFCRRHGARYARDPNGSLHVTAAPGVLGLYRFAHQAADFWLCEQCGVLVFSSVETPHGPRATLNVVGTDIEGLKDRPAQSMDFGEQPAEDRAARRQAMWTPLTLVEASPSA